MNKKNHDVIVRLFLGLFLCSLCTSFAVQSNIGLSPWAVFHQGLSLTLGITLGQASILTSFVIIVAVSFLGLHIGIGTICNILFIGICIDVIEFFDLIPTAESFPQGVMMMCISMLLNAVGSFLYIGCALGCGPRDGLMSVLTKKTGLPVGLVRAAIEGTVFVIGWMLGGQIGIGSILNVFGLGYSLNVVYHIMNFDVAQIEHKTLVTTINELKEKLS